MLAMIALLTSGSGMIRWIHTDRHWTQEVRIIVTTPIAPTDLNTISNSSQAATSCYLTLLSIVTPMFFVAWSLHCFIFGDLFHHLRLSGPLCIFTPAMLITGFSSQSIICRAVTVLWMVTYVVNMGTILIETMWKYAASLNHARYHQ
ncbi:uncharacterized protein BJ212DRAFT_1405217 [Suillus subaureus]|uniref:Uncharacterized protein n=1 Tax=Suillus subaureus TaxID=48587 RepID=A0A9P7IZ75_9AGAM|nr:uncharacterized protein BJ212DRAFT_1405217 [Suillus subaureus]KAG1797655.1 hypothetical protein BJ212DRAFT_1405217 [Suillus subaureus]